MLKCKLGFHDFELVDIQHEKIGDTPALKFIYICGECETVWSEMITDPLIVGVVEAME